VSIIEIITPIAMVLVAGGVSSRLVELIKRARWSGRARMQVVVKPLLRNHGYPPDKQDHATQLVSAQADVVCEEWVA
jgi:Domain of unknown function (DUF3387)